MPNISWMPAIFFENGLISSSFCDKSRLLSVLTVSEPTREGNVSDLIHATAPAIISRVRICKRLCKYDYIEFSVKINVNVSTM